MFLEKCTKEQLLRIVAHYEIDVAKKKKEKLGDIYVGKYSSLNCLKKGSLVIEMDKN